MWLRRCPFLGAVQLAVGQASVVVDDADHDRLAGLAGLVGLGALPRRPMARKPRTSGAQSRRYAAAPRPQSIHSVAWSDAPENAACATCRDKPRPSRSSSGADRSDTSGASAPVGLLPRLQDRLLLLGAQRPRTTPRDRSTSAQARPRHTILLAGGLPPMPPPMRRCRRDVQRRRGGPQRRTPLNQPDQLQTPSQSELAPTVFHVRLPSEMQSS